MVWESRVSCLQRLHALAVACRLGWDNGVESFISVWLSVEDAAEDLCVSPLPSLVL